MIDDKKLIERTYIFTERMLIFDYLYAKKRYSFMNIAKIMNLRKKDVLVIYDYYLKG